MREAFTDAIERGVHLLSFSANAFHWKVELLKDPSGHDVMMLEKRGSTDLWRTQISGTRLSEQCLFGAQYPLNPAGYGGPEAPFLTEPRSGPDAPPSEDLMSHWIFEGTGLAFGERIDGLMYGEVDSFHPDHPYPDVIDQIVFLSPYRNGSDHLINALTTYFMRPNGQMTFHAGSFYSIMR